MELVFIGSIPIYRLCFICKILLPVGQIVKTLPSQGRIESAILSQAIILFMEDKKMDKLILDPKFNKEHLLAEIRQGKKHRFLGFFGGKDTKDIALSLSNFYYGPFVYTWGNKKITFTCNEQFFMWSKALQFRDFEVAKKIIDRGYDPVTYKHLGRLVKNYDDNVWKKHRESAMYTGLMAKFSQNRDMRKYLLGTGNAVLVECNKFDYIWSCGLSPQATFSNVSQWRGDNRLGFLLMQVREELRK